MSFSHIPIFFVTSILAVCIPSPSQFIYMLSKINNYFGAGEELISPNRAPTRCENAINFWTQLWTQVSSVESNCLALKCVTHSLKHLSTRLLYVFIESFICISFSLFITSSFCAGLKFSKSAMFCIFIS